MHRSLMSAVLSLSVLLSALVVAQGASYTFTTIDVPGAQITQAHGINDRGQIVGLFFADAMSHGFVTDVITFTPIGVPDAMDTLIERINDRGQIVGWFRDGTGTHGFVASPRQ